jgi:hypothetical protein
MASPLEILEQLIKSAGDAYVGFSNTSVALGGFELNLQNVVKVGAEVNNSLVALNRVTSLYGKTANELAAQTAALAQKFYLPYEQLLSVQQKLAANLPIAITRQKELASVLQFAAERFGNTQQGIEGYIGALESLSSKSQLLYQDQMLLIDAAERMRKSMKEGGETASSASAAYAQQAYISKENARLMYMTGEISRDEYATIVRTTEALDEQNKSRLQLSESASRASNQLRSAQVDMFASLAQSEQFNEFFKGLQVAPGMLAASLTGIITAKGKDLLDVESISASSDELQDVFAAFGDSVQGYMKQAADDGKSFEEAMASMRQEISQAGPAAEKLLKEFMSQEDSVKKMRDNYAAANSSALKRAAVEAMIAKYQQDGNQAGLADLRNKIAAQLIAEANQKSTDLNRLILERTVAQAKIYNDLMSSTVQLAEHQLDILARIKDTGESVGNVGAEQLRISQEIIDAGEQEFRLLAQTAALRKDIAESSRRIKDAQGEEKDKFGKNLLDKLQESIEAAEAGIAATPEGEGKVLKQQELERLKQERDITAQRLEQGKLSEIAANAAKFEAESKRFNLTSQQAYGRSLEQAGAIQLKMSEKEVQFAAKRVSLEMSQLDLLDNIASGIGASATARAAAAEAQGRVVKANEDGIAQMRMFITAQEEQLLLARQSAAAAAAAGNQELAGQEMTRVANLASSIQAREQDILGLTTQRNQALKSQLELTKQIREGYLTAITAMNEGAGIFQEIVVDQSKNLGVLLRTADDMPTSLRTGSNTGPGAGISKFTASGLEAADWTSDMAAYTHDMVSSQIPKIIEHLSKIANRPTGDMASVNPYRIAQMVEQGGDGSAANTPPVAPSASRPPSAPSGLVQPSQGSPAPSGAVGQPLGGTAALPIAQPPAPASMYGQPSVGAPAVISALSAAMLGSVPGTGFVTPKTDPLQPVKDAAPAPSFSEEQVKRSIDLAQTDRARIVSELSSKYMDDKVDNLIQSLDAGLQNLQKNGASGLELWRAIAEQNRALQAKLNESVAAAQKQAEAKSPGVKPPPEQKVSTPSADVGTSSKAGDLSAIVGFTKAVQSGIENVANVFGKGASGLEGAFSGLEKVLREIAASMKSPPSAGMPVVKAELSSSLSDPESQSLKAVAADAGIMRAELSGLRGQIEEIQSLMRLVSAQGGGEYAAVLDPVLITSLSGFASSISTSIDRQIDVLSSISNGIQDLSYGQDLGEDVKSSEQASPPVVRSDDAPLYEAIGRLDEIRGLLAALPTFMAAKLANSSEQTDLDSKPAQAYGDVTSSLAASISSAGSSVSSNMSEIAKALVENRIAIQEYRQWSVGGIQNLPIQNVSNDSDQEMYFSILADRLAGLRESGGENAADLSSDQLLGLVAEVSRDTTAQLSKISEVFGDISAQNASSYAVIADYMSSLSSAMGRSASAVPDQVDVSPVIDAVNNIPYTDILDKLATHAELVRRGDDQSLGLMNRLISEVAGLYAVLNSGIVGQAEDKVVQVQNIQEPTRTVPVADPALGGRFEVVDILDKLLKLSGDISNMSLDVEPAVVSANIDISEILSKIRGAQVAQVSPVESGEKVNVSDLARNIISTMSQIPKPAEADYGLDSAPLTTDMSPLVQAIRSIPTLPIEIIESIAASVESIGMRDFTVTPPDVVVNIDQDSASISVDSTGVENAAKDIRDLQSNFLNMIGTSIDGISDSVSELKNSTRSVGAPDIAEAKVLSDITSPPQDPTGSLSLVMLSELKKLSEYLQTDAASANRPLVMPDLVVSVDRADLFSRQPPESRGALDLDQLRLLYSRMDRHLLLLSEIYESSDAPNAGREYVEFKTLNNNQSSVDLGNRTETQQASVANITDAQNRYAQILSSYLLSAIESAMLSSKSMSPNLVAENASAASADAEFLSTLGGAVRDLSVASSNLNLVRSDISQMVYDNRSSENMGDISASIKIGAEKFAFEIGSYAVIMNDYMRQGIDQMVGSVQLGASAYSASMYSLVSNLSDVINSIPNRVVSSQVQVAEPAASPDETIFVEELISNISRQLVNIRENNPPSVDLKPMFDRLEEVLRGSLTSVGDSAFNFDSLLKSIPATDISADIDRSSVLSSAVVLFGNIRDYVKALSESPPFTALQQSESPLVQAKDAGDPIVKTSVDESLKSKQPVADSSSPNLMMADLKPYLDYFYDRVSSIDNSVSLLNSENISEAPVSFSLDSTAKPESLPSYVERSSGNVAPISSPIDKFLLEVPPEVIGLMRDLAGASGMSPADLLQALDRALTGSVDGIGKSVYNGITEGFARNLAAQKDFEVSRMTAENARVSSAVKANQLSRDILIQNMVPSRVDVSVQTPQLELDSIQSSLDKLYAQVGSLLSLQQQMAQPMFNGITGTSTTINDTKPVIISRDPVSQDRMTSAPREAVIGSETIKLSMPDGFVRSLSTQVAEITKSQVVPAIMDGFANAIRQGFSA